MIRIGAILEGLFRRYRPFAEGDSGDRNIYSVIADEWERTRIGIEKLMMDNGETPHFEACD